MGMVQYLGSRRCIPYVITVTIIMNYVVIIITNQTIPSINPLLPNLALNWVHVKSDIIRHIINI